MFNGLHAANGPQEAFISNCFPVRPNMRLRSLNAPSNGAWLVVYRKNQKRQLKAVLCSRSKTYDDIKKQREIAEAHGIPIGDVELVKQPPPTTSEKMLMGKALSKQWLLKHLKLSTPSDAAVIRIESCDLTRVDDTDLNLFENVVHVKAADNILPIDAFIKFPALETLEMQMNCLGSATSVTASLLTIDNNMISISDIYPNLRHLNLDYNDLGPADFDSLSLLVNLESLSVVGNRLHNFPPPDYQKLEANLFFPSLMTLDISDNAASLDSDFLYLCGMPKLQKLVVANNSIKAVPSIHFTGHRYAIVPTKHNFSDTKGAAEEMEDESARALSTIAETTSERSTPALLLLPPFPELTVVDLSNNLISNDIALAGILAWPSLKQVILDGNPLARRDEKLRRRYLKKLAKKQQEPPQHHHVDAASSICEFLEQSLGIDVVRSKSSSQANDEAKKTSIGSAPGVLRRYPGLEAKVPKVPRCDVDKLLALCAPPPFESQIPALPPQEVEDVQDEEDGQPETPAIDSQREEAVHGDANIQFFMTELADIDGDQIRAECEKALGKPAPKKAAENFDKKSQALVVYDPKFRGFEELFTNDDDDDQEAEKAIGDLPTNIHDSVHVLRTVLELPSVSRRPVAAIEAWANRQMAARRKLSSTTLQTMSAIGRVNDREPIRYEPYVPKQGLGPKQTRTHDQIVEEVAIAQRNRRTVTEAPLGSVLRGGKQKHPKMYKSARRLMRQITGQYDEIRRNLDRVTTAATANSSRGFSKGDDGLSTVDQN